MVFWALLEEKHEPQMGMSHLNLGQLCFMEVGDFPMKLAEGTDSLAT